MTQQLQFSGWSLVVVESSKESRVPGLGKRLHPGESGMSRSKTNTRRRSVVVRFCRERD